ncbi:aminopeptidase [Escherichia coli]|nr:aminopeptidase [Escherichia coli]
MQEEMRKYILFHILWYPGQAKALTCNKNKDKNENEDLPVLRI